MSAAEMHKRVLAFLSDGMADLGLYEVRARHDRLGDFIPGRSLPGVAGGRWRFFGVLPRKREGGKKADVVDQANLLWLDVDSRDALDHLGVFDNLGLPPSAVINSGGGYWLYWKLSRLVATDLVEEWVRRLNVYARPLVPDVDPACWNRNRNARLPGTVHEDTGVIAGVVDEATSWQRVDPERVEQALADVVVPSKQPTIPARDLRPVSVLSQPPEVRSVFNRFAWYLIDPPDVEDLAGRGKSRSEIEFALAVALIHDAGCSEDEAKALFDEWEVPKHVEKKRTVPGNPYGYADLTIQNAAALGVPSARASSSSAKGSWTRVDRYRVLRLVWEAEQKGSPLTVKEACAAIIDLYPTARTRTAENALSQLEESGYIDKPKNPNDGRGKIVVVTAKGKGLLEQTGFQKGVHLLVPLVPTDTDKPRRRLVRGSQPSKLRRGTAKKKGKTEPTPSVVFSQEAVGAGSSGSEETTNDSTSCVYRPELFGYRASRYRTHFGVDTPDEKVASILKRNWIDDSYRISFLGKQTRRTIQFLTPWEDTLNQMLFYEQLFVGRDEYSDSTGRVIGMEPLYKSFISQRDHRLGGPTAEDPIADHAWGDYHGNTISLAPYPWTVGLAVEVTDTGEPVTRTVIDQAGNELILPSYGLVLERDWDKPGVFWNALRRDLKKQTVSDLTAHRLAVTRTGPARKHKFAFEIAGDAIDFIPPTEAEIDLDALAEDLASKERIAMYIEPLPEPFCPFG